MGKKGLGQNHETSNFWFIDYITVFDWVDHNKLWKISQEIGIPDHLTCLLRNLYAEQEATVRIGHGTKLGPTYVFYTEDKSRLQVLSDVPPWSYCDCHCWCSNMDSSLETWQPEVWRMRYYFAFGMGWGMCGYVVHRSSPQPCEAGSSIFLILSIRKLGDVYGFSSTSECQGGIQSCLLVPYKWLSFLLSTSKWRTVCYSPYIQFSSRHCAGDTLRHAEIN